MVNCCGEIKWIHSTFLDANVQTIMNWSKYVHMAICMHFAIWNSMLDITEIITTEIVHLFFEHVPELHTQWCNDCFLRNCIFSILLVLFHICDWICMFLSAKKSGFSIWDGCKHFDWETSIQMCVFWRVKVWYSVF